MHGPFGQLHSSYIKLTTLFVLAVSGVVAQAQPAPIGFDPVEWDAAPFEFDTAEQDGIRVELVATGFARPFGFAMLPSGDALISERGAALLLVENATGTGGASRLAENPVSGSPARGVGRGRGLHDIVLHPDFESNGLVYYTHNEPGPNNAEGQMTTALTLSRARYDDAALHDAEVIFRGEAVTNASGSRIAFDGNGMLYLTTGAPFDDDAQALDNVYGKVLRITEDGDIPADNPFAGQAGARGEIYSLGHRDQLGLTVHPETGSVLAVEHGPNGGDELNLILPGRNYGWPEYSFGRTYEGPRHSERPLGPDTEQPLVLWLPSIGPTGLNFYEGDAFPQWQGNLFVGSARRGEIAGTGSLERIVFNESLEEVRRESLLGGLHQRIRDVRTGPDGMLYVLTDDRNPALLRISPQ